MKILIYILEGIFSFFIIWGLDFGLNNLFRKKFNVLMSGIFSFIIIGFIGFFVSPYVFSFPKPFLIYLPIAFFFFIIKILKIIKT
jgi:hypothetical protein